MQIASLGSGSKGNSTIIRCGSTNVLVDCGFSLAQFEKRLQKLSVSASEIDAILVTHEHSDHGSGVKRIAQKYDIPLYMTVGTARALQISCCELINGSHEFTLGNLHIKAVTVPHDAAEPVQFVFTTLDTNRKLGILTDSGHISSHMKQAYDDCHGLLLEFNYDEQMLENGPYPENLKQRISGGFGHLSNKQSIEMLQQLNTRQLDCLIAAHISEKNNSPHLVADLLQDLTLSIEPILACQQQGFDWKKI
jgi:phosphoribosyl 1,2-cyclic phosphodiesterase